MTDTIPIVEVGSMGVQAGKTPLDASTADGALLLDAWKSIIAAPGGPVSIIWGLEKGNERSFCAWFEWESLQAHQEFAVSFGGIATQRFGEVFTPDFTKHAFHSTAPLRYPVTQVLTAFFPATTPQDLKEGVAESFERARTLIVESKSALQVGSAGWGLESDFPIRGRGGNVEGEKGAVFYVLLGWREFDDVAMKEVKENMASQIGQVEESRHRANEPPYKTSTLIVPIKLEDRSSKLRECFIIDPLITRCYKRENATSDPMIGVIMTHWTPQSEAAYREKISKERSEAAQHAITAHHQAWHSASLDGALLEST